MSYTLMERKGLAAKDAGMRSGNSLSNAVALAAAEQSAGELAMSVEDRVKELWGQFMTLHDDAAKRAVAEVKEDPDAGKKSGGWGGKKSGGSSSGGGSKAPGTVELNFGKFKGMTISKAFDDIERGGESWLCWFAMNAKRNDDGKNYVLDKAREFLAGKWGVAGEELDRRIQQRKAELDEERDA